jgi:trehalose 6-phosphate synthase/phosphatase
VSAEGVGTELLLPIHTTAGHLESLGAENLLAVRIAHDVLYRLGAAVADEARDIADTCRCTIRLVTGSLSSSMLPPDATMAAVLQLTRERGRVLLLLDYDGTLVPLAPFPELAAPDSALLTQLRALAHTPRVALEIVSGRARETLEAWFGDLPVSLWAEHGLWHRTRRGADWRPTVNLDPRRLQAVRSILDRFVVNTPGARVEVKTASLAWHYRGAAEELGIGRSQELRTLLRDIVGDDLEVLEGSKVLEVRFRGVSKAVVARRLGSSGQQDTAVIAFGDDTTDEELFVALPPSSVTIAVGRPLRGARYVVDDFRQVRRILGVLVR